MAKRIRHMPCQLQWLEGALPGRVQIHLTDFGSALIENYICVQRFTPKQISVIDNRGLIEIEGDNLTLSEVQTGAMIVRGDIFCIRRDGREKSS